MLTILMLLCLGYIARIIVAAPRVYLNSGFSDVMVCSITFAAGADDAFSSVDSICLPFA